VFKHRRAIEPEHTCPDNRLQMRINGECHGQRASRSGLRGNTDETRATSNCATSDSA
jgi:hypothetical protein